MQKRMQIKRWLAALCVWAIIGGSTCAALDTVQESEASQSLTMQQIQDTQSQESQGTEQPPTQPAPDASAPSEPELTPTPEEPEAPPSEPETEPEDPALSVPNPEPDPQPEDPALSQPEPEPESPDIPSYTVTLDSCTIGAGETRAYTTISSEFAGNDRLPEGYYPGNLTVELRGTVTIESGGCLAIGPLSIGGSEASPVVRATLSDTGLIVVKAGGQLKLTQVQTDFSGTGILIVQEPGASVNLISTSIDDGLIAWAAPVVNNRQDQPDTVWLPVGQTLIADLLPQTLRTNLQYLGSEERVDVDTVWDLSGYDGRTSGSIQLPGTFIGEDGQALDSVVPLTLTVNWYEPGRIVVTDTIWLGADACSAGLVVDALPENGTVWGEVSSDGTTWSRWPEFEVLTDDHGVKTCMFFETEPTPSSYYRVVAQDHDTMRILISEAFLLPEEIGEDQGGNRGGGTAYHPPARHPSTVTDQEDTEDIEDTEKTEENQEYTDADFSVLEELLDLDGLLSTMDISDWMVQPQPVPGEDTEEQETPILVTDAVSTPLPIERLEKEPESVSVWRETVQNERVQDNDDSAQTQTAVAVASDLPQPESVRAESDNAQTVLAQPEPSVEQSDAENEEASRLPYPLQIALIAAGLIVCVVIGITVAGVGPLRKKKP